MSSSGRNNCNLWRIWYSVLIFVSYIYLFYKAIARYASFRKLTLNHMWPQGVLNFYLTMITLSMALLPIMIYVTLFKTQNYANDGVIFGKNDHDIILVKSGILKKHLQPYFVLIHIISAYILLVPIPILMATQIFYGKCPKDYVWSTDFNFLYYPYTFRSNYSGYEIDKSIDLLPSITPEFVNYVASLVIFMGNYPSAFWFTNRIYSLIFSFLIFLGNLNLLFDFSAMSIYYKVAVNLDLVGKKLLLANISPLFIPIISTASIFLVLIANGALFQYGLSQYWLNLKKNNNFTAVISGFSIQKRGRKRLCSNSYLPQIVAFVLLAVIVCCKLPILLDYTKLYRDGGLSSMLFVSVLITAIYIIILTITWIVFSLKTRRWKLSNYDQLYGLHNNRYVRTNSTVCSANTDTCSQISSSLHSRQTNNYVYLSNTLSNIPTISENVDNNSVYSYGSHASQALTLPNSRKIMYSNSTLPLAANNSKRNTIGKHLASSQCNGATNVMLPSEQQLTTSSLQRYSNFKDNNKVTFKKKVHITIPAPSCGPDFAISSGIFDESECCNNESLASCPFMHDAHENGVICYPEPEYLHVPDILMSERSKSDSSLSEEKRGVHELCKEESLIEHLNEKMCSQV